MFRLYAFSLIALHKKKFFLYSLIVRCFNSLTRVCRLLPFDQLYLRLVFISRIGRPPDFDNPRTIQELIQVNKLAYKNDPYIKALADKYLVRSFLSNIGYEHILSNLLFVQSIGNYNLRLIQPFLGQDVFFKLSNDCGSSISLRNFVNVNQFSSYVTRCLSSKSLLVKRTREYQYSELPYLMIEKSFSSSPVDYKFFINDLSQFLFCQVGVNIAKQDYLSYYDSNGQSLAISLLPGLNCSPNPQYESQIDPAVFQTLRSIALDMHEKLSLPFCRIDFLVSDGNYQFSEITFSPSSGFKLLLNTDLSPSSCNSLLFSS